MIMIARVGNWNGRIFEVDTKVEMGDIEQLKKRKKQGFQNTASGRVLIRKGDDPRKNAEKFF